ncbi:MAG TPA: DUF167 domain-containing protein [bacterium]|nr:DUF167 domain-containing protein [bacterium]
MRIEITVKPGSRRPGVEKLPDGTYRVAVNAPPREGRANEAVIEALAGYFDVPKSSIRIRMGSSGRKKVVEIDERE